jgi:fumarate reductase subunit C
MSGRRPYNRPIPKTWWLKDNFYRNYMIREASSIFLGIYTVILLVGLVRLLQGPEAYGAWLEALRSPLSILFHLAALALCGYHTVTWFAATPKAMRLQFGKEKVPDKLIVQAHYAGAAVISLVVLIMAIVGG